MYTQISFDCPAHLWLRLIFADGGKLKEMK